MELNLKSHWGALLRRWIYAVVLIGLAVGLAFLTQYLWQIAWYMLFAPIAGLIVLGMTYNTVNTLRTRVQTMGDEGISVREGVLGDRVHRLLYNRMISYETKPNRLDDKLGCVTVVLSAYVGATDKDEVSVCLSTQDAEQLLSVLAKHLTH